MNIQRCWYVVLKSLLPLCCSADLALSQTNSGSTTQVYNDDRIQVAIPATWTSRLIYRHNGDVSHSSKDLIGVAVSDGLFDLDLLTHYGQSSGAKGGRFSEVSRYVASWLKDDEPNACLEIFKRSIKQVSKELSRVDLILNSKTYSQSNDPLCLAMQKQLTRTVWAGTYFGSARDDRRQPGFFIILPLGTDVVSPDNQMVFAVASRTTTLDSLPLPDDARLRSFLAQADRVVAGIRYR